MVDVTGHTSRAIFKGHPRKTDMSDRTGRSGSTLTPSQGARRKFVKQVALATAGTLGIGARLAMAQASEIEAEGPKLSDCPKLRAPMAEVAGKVAFITGGSSGIGLGIARAFADAGMKVVISYRNKKHLDNAINYLRSAQAQIHAIGVDVTDRRGMEKAAAEAKRKFGKIHVLVNNAGVIGYAPLSSTTYDDWDWILNVNVNGVFNGIHAFLPYIQSHNEGGHIIATSSIGGLIASELSAAYNTSKFAVVGLMECLRAEFLNSNIGVSVYCPGMVRSNIINSARNRPKERTNTGFNNDRKLISQLEESMHDVNAAMNPLEAGALVLKGMRNNDMYILTHSQLKEYVRVRGEALLASFPQVRDGQSAAARPLTPQQSIYTIERDRRLCRGSR